MDPSFSHQGIFPKTPNFTALATSSEAMTDHQSSEILRIIAFSPVPAEAEAERHRYIRVC